MQASDSLGERPVRLHQEVRRSKPACDLDPTLALWDGPAADIEPLETGARTGVTVSECAAIGVMAMKAASPHMARACFILVLRKAWKGADARPARKLGKRFCNPPVDSTHAAPSAKRNTQRPAAFCKGTTCEALKWTIGAGAGGRRGTCSSTSLRANLSNARRPIIRGSMLRTRGVLRPP